MNGEKDTAQKTAGEYFGRRFEGLSMGAEPNIKDLIAAHSLVDASGDGFHLWKFGHRLIIASRKGSPAPDANCKCAAAARGGTADYCVELIFSPPEVRMRLASKLTIFHLPWAFRT